MKGRNREETIGDHYCVISFQTDKPEFKFGNRRPKESKLVTRVKSIIYRQKVWHVNKHLSQIRLSEKPY